MQPLPAWMRLESRGITLALRVQPGARRSAVLGPYGDQLKVAVQAPPVDGRANEALLRYLSSSLQIRNSALHVLSGSSSRDKAVLIECDRAEAPVLAERILRLLDV